jgi:cold shock CspA family protein
MVKWSVGTVSWFDEQSGEGMIKSKDGKLHYVHYSAIDSTKKWKTLKENRSVKFKIAEDDTFSHVLKVKEL